MELKNTFMSLVNHYTRDKVVMTNLWSEIEQQYSSKNRHYHTLLHLDHLLKQLLDCRDHIKNWDAMLFALYYHDIVYIVLKKNNEEKSASLSEIRMSSLRISKEIIGACTRHILATKKHQHSDDPDTNFFTDADLSILGADWESYDRYRLQVRKEYAVYPDLLYKPGRRKVLQHFLQMARIFKTDPFYNLFEKNAIQNLTRELQELE